MFTDNPIPAWIRERILRLEQQEVLDDSALADLHFALLNHLFPLLDGFLVAPRLRTKTSTGPITPSDDLNGEPATTNVFCESVVSVATGELDGDTPILVWEWRKGDSRMEALDYDGWADDHCASKNCRLFM